jgi:NTE family protein
MSAGPQLSLALQGGGSHGAFTWGVLDRLLDEPHLVVDRVAGTSAGGLNGAALVTGWVRGGRLGAQENLAALWEQVATVGAMVTLLHAPLRKPGIGGVWDDATPVLSPYLTNPFAMAPLAQALQGVVDVDALRSAGAPALYVNAVSARTGLSRVFGPDDITLQAILAAACAPLVFQAMEIDGEPYWDGSYGSNPMLWPLHEDKPQADILLVELTPIRRDDTPRAAKDILNRINEIASIGGLVGELKDIQRRNAGDQRAAVRMHRVSLPAIAPEDVIDPSSKRSVGRQLFRSLKELGASACDDWLTQHRGSIGKRSTFDFERDYLRAHAGRVQMPGLADAA